MQTIAYDDCSYTTSSGPVSGDGLPGLDETFPFPYSNPPTDTEADDAPDAALPGGSGVTSYNRQFSAEMWLFWKPSSGDVYVPVGYIPWSFNGTATATTGNPPWTASGSGGKSGYTPANGAVPSWFNLTGQCFQ